MSDSLPPNPDAPPAPSLARSITRSAIWTGASQYLLFGLGIIKTVILARLIGPDLVGLLAGATVWASYFGFARTELRLAVYSSKEEPEVLNTQFILENLTGVAGLGVAALVLLIWPGLVQPMATWPLIFILMAEGLFETLTSTPIYLVDRRLRQDVMSKITIFSALVGFIVPVLLAVGGAYMPALLADLLIPPIIQRAGAAIFIGWRPRWIWNETEWRAQLRLAWTMWTTGILGKVTFQFDDWLVFNVKGPRTPVWLGSGVEPEGLYSRAYNIGKMPMDVVAGMIGSIALSVYSEGAAQGQEVLQRVYRQMTWILAWIIFFSSTMAFAAANEITHILLGDYWLPMVPLLQLMFLFIIGRPFFQNNSQLLQALRQEKDYRWTTFIQAIFLIIVCPIAVYFWGAAGASVAVSLMSIVGFVLTERLVTKHLKLAIWPTYIAPGLTCLGVIGVLAALGPVLPGNAWASVILKGVVSLIAFGGILILFERQQALAAWGVLKQGLGRR